MKRLSLVLSLVLAAALVLVACGPSKNLGKTVGESELSTLSAEERASVDAARVEVDQAQQSVNSAKTEVDQAKRQAGVAKEETKRAKAEMLRPQIQIHSKAQ